MAKAKTLFACASCGTGFPKWHGRCPSCGEWETLAEERVSDERRKGLSLKGPAAAPCLMSDMDGVDEDRIKTSVEEFDRVLGGGMVKGSAVLIGGDPGIGKSTLLLDIMARVASAGNDVLYVSGEESARQIRLRGQRLGLDARGLYIYCETSVERVLEQASRMRPAAIVVDSIQTVFTEAVGALPGSVSQIRESASLLISSAKALDIVLFLVGHVTKDGLIAGPKVLEHMVDTVLYFEGDNTHAFRVLRAMKNRYGSVMEIGVFEMKDTGLAEVANPSEVFLSQRPEGAAGSAVAASIEGTRTILVEVQSLISATAFGMPRRTVAGVDYNKVLLLAAVLEKKAGIGLSNHDIYLKVAGGLCVDEPAVDLCVAASLASSRLEMPVGPKTAVFGEVGLSGEVRAVARADARVREAAKLGFTACVLPRDNMKDINTAQTPDIVLTGVSTVAEAMEALFGRTRGEDHGH